MTKQKIAKSHSRRRFLKTLAAGAMAGPFFSYRNVFASAAKKVVVASGSGTYLTAQTEGYFKPFTRETGIEVELHSIMSLAEKRAMVESKNVTVDVFGNEYSDAVVMGKNGWLETIDYSGFRSEDLDAIPAVDRTPYGLAINYWAEVMSYRTDVFPEGKRPTNWTEFWDVKRFAGPRCLGDPSYGYAIEFALLADGVAPEKLYPLDIERALKSMSRIRQDVTAWWGKAAAQPAQMMNDKEVVACSVSNGRIVEIIDAGAPVAIEWNQGAIHKSAYHVPKGSPNKENAFKLLAYVARPEPQAEAAKRIAFGPTNPLAYKLLDAKTTKFLPANPEYRDKMFRVDYDWWTGQSASGKSNRELIVEKWEEWKLKG
jgi:putative spermidine/putrescine transport system substrate-binding protein